MPRFSRYMSQETGTMSIEAVIVFPLLLWAFGATFVFWDAFHAQSVSQRAACTIADVLSRETDPVDADYLAGLQDVQSYLPEGKLPTRIRVTTLNWNATTGAYEVIWSRTPETQWEELTDELLNARADRIPNMASGDIAILVETHTAYYPLMNFGIPPMTMENFVITRPRFGPQLIWEETDGTQIGFTGDDQTVAEPDA